jgi:Clp amino terminal domain, pathogenicity island component
MGARRRTDLLAAAAIVATGVVAWLTQPPGGTYTFGGRSVLWPMAVVGWLTIFYLMATDRVWGPWRLTRLRQLRRRIWKPRRPDFDRVTPIFHAAMERAESEVRRFDHRGIGTEHMLLGLLGDPESPAGRLLVEAGLEIESARNRLEEAVGRGDEPTPEKMRLTVDGRRAMEIAFERARRRGNRPVEDHHLLEGVTAISDCVGVWLLIDAGVSVVELGRAAAALGRR